MKVIDVATICHEANRALCESQDDFSQARWNHAPEWQKDSAVAGVRFHLARQVRPVPPSASHESWVRRKLEEGWKYGPVKDPGLKEHPCMVAFEQLPPDQQAKDHLFGAIVAALEPFIEQESDAVSSR